MAKKTKQFKLHFYKIEIDETLFSDSKNKYSELIKLLNKVKKPENVYSINGYQSYVKPIQNKVYCFEKHRIDDLPSVGNINNNSERNLELKEGETLIEKNYFLIDDKLGYIIYQEKNEGFRANTLSGYFKQLLGEKSSKVHIYQLLQTSAYERLIKYGYLKSMELSLATPTDSMLKEFGINLDNRILYRKNKRLNVSVKVSLEKKETIAEEFIQNIHNLFKKNSDHIRSLSLKGSETEEANLDDINLAKDILEAQADVRIENNQIVEEDMIADLEKAHRVHNGEVRELIKE